MSKIKAAIITAIIGSSSAAMASPTVSFNADAQFSFGTSTGPIIRDHGERGAMPQYAVQTYQRPAATWVSLSSPLSLEYGRDILRPQMRLRDVAQIRLQAANGYSYIHKVSLRFRDGSMQTMMFNKWLTNRNPMLQFDVNSDRAIDAIIIVGTTSDRGGTYQVFAQTSPEMSRPPVYEPQPAPVLNVSGHYTSVYGDVFLTQHGDQVRGTYPGKQGTIEGTIQGNQLHFRWAQPALRIQDTAGMGVFYFDGRGHIDGTWGLGTAETGSEWDLNVAAR